jgi:O-antigen/teichoic acid export membrane protein
MLGWWRTAPEIGFYSASQKIVQFLYILPAVLTSAIFPVLSRLIGQKDSGEKIKLLLEKSVLAVLLIAVPLTVGGIILAKPIIELIYGREYLSAVLSFQLLIVTTLIIFPATLIGNSILAYDKQRKMAGYVAIAAFGNIIFNAILIPPYGIYGAAFATIVTQLISNSFSWRLLKKINNFYTFRYLKKIIASAIIMGIFSFMFNKLGLNLIVNIIASAGIYFGGLYLLKEEILEEIKIILKAIKK